VVRARRAAPARAAALLCAVLVALTGTGCGGAPTRPGAAGARALLARHARALLRRDEPGYLADVAPAARPAQRAVFEHLAAVPLAAWSYQDPGGPGEDGVVRAHLAYKLRGFDTSAVRADVTVTLVASGGRWRISRETVNPAQLWQQGTVRVARGTDALVLGTGKAALGSYATEAARAVRTVSGLWGATRVVVEVPSSLAAMAALLGAKPADYRNIAAVTTGEVGGTGHPPSDRVIVNPAAYAGLSAFGRQAVLTHETTHVATRPFTTARTPLWLSEGAADFTAYLGSGRTAPQLAPELAGDVHDGRVPAALPTDAAFTTTAGGLAQAYEGAWLACRMIATAWGTDRLTALYRAAGREGAAKALRSVLGVSEAEFTARWRTYVREELS
jgi:hypothetical protein